MLANGIKLAFSETKGNYQNLVGLKEVPEFGIEPEKVEITPLQIQ
ncbi:Lj965 prophage major tail protein [Streptococcus pneumoniae]|nr:Lj965 prophage major tail protein [Streptococcus pneumoniae]